MNRIIKYTALSMLIFLGSCTDDFLDKYPLDALSEETFFNNADDLRTYVNGLYNAMPRYDFQGGAQGAINVRDLDADVQIIGRSVPGNLNQLGADGLAPQTSGAWNSGYSQIRRANYLLVNYDKVNERDAISNQFIGEGYFFRAWHYFNMLVNFGDVPIILKPLNMSDDEELYRPRDSRTDVARRIIQDLDSAITNLQWKGAGEAHSGRINKQAAIVMKARVALFEGTWEHYHSQKGTQFAVPGEDGRAFLEMIGPAVQELIDYQGAAIYRNGGPFNEPYNQLFAIEDGHSADGVFWFRSYSTDLMNRSHNFYGRVSGTGNFSITKRLVDMYLDNDGIPQDMSNNDLTLLNDLGQNLDPRFRQTIWTPDRGPLAQVEGRGEQGDFNLRYPFISEGSDIFIPTGYRVWKGAVLDPSQFRAGEQDDILIRYAEGLLAYAEAKAILGTITQADLDQTVNVLRDRVGMVPMNLATVESWNISYDETEGFDPTASNIVNEIRRERTVELALEGFRLEDIKRWAVFENVINGHKPKGAHLDEFLEYFNDQQALNDDGWDGSIDLTLIEGDNVGTFEDGYINPLFRNTQFQEGGVGLFIDEGRDYLAPIPRSEINLYSQSGVTLTQNPGWGG